MKKIVCELCGESDFLKVAGMFECQVCGAKYSLEDARKLFVEVDESEAFNQAPTQTEAPEYVEETPVLAPRAVPTTVRRVVVQKTPSNDPSAARRIVTTVQKGAQARDTQGKTTVRKVVVKPTAPVQKQPQPVKRAPEATSKPVAVNPGLGVETGQLVQNYFILAQTAYDSENYMEAENYANRIIEVQKENCDAWLMKGNCAGWQTYTNNFRLLESINCWNTCLLNASGEEKDDYLFTVRTNCIEVAIGYILRNIQEFKKNPNEDSLTLIKETIDFVEPMMRKANQTFGVDLIVYEDRLASNISALVNEISKASVAKFGKKKEQQTEEAFKALIKIQDVCISIWDYLMGIAKKHGTVNAILHNIIKMHELIIRSCAYKEIGNKLKEVYRISMAEKNTRLEMIQKSKKKREDKFVDIRKRDRVEQKVKNAKYWEEHQEEKQELLNERSRLDHEVFELENAKLKMPELKELKKLEEEAIKLQVLKDNPTYSNKERAAFMEELQKLRKLIVKKKREIAGIVEPMDKRIEDLKKRIFNIDNELNMNR